MWKALASFDQSSFFGINRLGSEVMDPIVAYLSFSGRGLVLLVVLTPLIFLFSHKYRVYRALGLWLLVFVVEASSGFLKIFFDRPRPFITFEKELGEGMMRLVDFFGIPSSPAFPSGHSMMVFAVAAYLHHLYGKKMRPLYLWAAGVALSRIYLGVHYPSDILAGAVLGSVIGWFLVELLLRFKPDICHKDRPT